MLRIRIQDLTSVIGLLVLEGKLTEKDLSEFQSACDSAYQHYREVQLDLKDVIFIDEPGIIALKKAEQKGMLIGRCSAFVRELLRQFHEAN